MAKLELTTFKSKSRRRTTGTTKSSLACCTLWLLDEFHKKKTICFCLYYCMYCVFAKNPPKHPCENLILNNFFDERKFLRIRPSKQYYFWSPATDFFFRNISLFYLKQCLIIFKSTIKTHSLKCTPYLPILKTWL